MAVWQIVIEKLYGNEYWVNDYHIQANDSLNVATVCSVIANIERQISPTSVAFTKARYRPAGSSAQGTVIPLGFNGLLTNLSNMAPLFNVVRVDMAPASGRVGRKYLRGVLDQASSLNGALSSASVAYYNENYAAPIVALGYVCKENGSLFVSAACIPAVAMRQLRRGSKRRLQPII